MYKGHMSMHGQGPHISQPASMCTIPTMQVCEAQLQFAPRAALPVFGGTNGPEIKKSITDIQDAFQALVANLRELQYDILDVKATR